MISVIYSAVNPGKLGFESAKSTLKSLPEDSEIVFFLDPSSDDSEKLLGSIVDKRFRLIKSERNLGFANGLNIAAEESRGDFIARLDADDISFPWRWNYQLKHMQRTDIHFGSLLHQFSKGKFSLFVPHYPVHLNSSEFKLLASEANPGFHPAAMIRRSVFLDLGGYSQALSEDYDFWLRAANAGYVLERGLVPVTVYRHHANQATRQSGWEDRVMNEGNILFQRRQLWSKLERDGMDIKRTLIELAVRSPMSLIEFRRVFAKLWKKA